MGKVLFSDSLRSCISVNEYLGPVIMVTNIANLTGNAWLKMRPELKDVVEDENVWLINTTIEPLPPSNVLIYGDKVRVSEDSELDF